MQKLNTLALGYAGAILSALGMLVMGILGNLGIYMKAVDHMTEWHILFSLSLGGIVAGMVEAAILSFITLWVFGWLYNKLVIKRGE